MSRVQNYLTVLSDPSCLLEGEHPDDDLIREVIIRICFADGVVTTDEFNLLKRIFPTMNFETLRAFVSAVVSSKPDLAPLAARFTGTPEATELIQVVQHVAWADQHLEKGEATLLDQILGVLGLDLNGDASR